MKMLIEKGGDLTAGKTSPIVEAARNGHLECIQFILAHCKTIPQDQLSRALVSAADFGSLLIVEEVIRAGADLNFEQDERTALMKAAKGDHFEVVQLLLSKGASVNFKSSKNDATALSLACSEGNMEIAEFLIRNGADPMLKMDDGVNCFMEVARHGSIDLMSLLVEFTKGNMPMDKDPPKLGITRCSSKNGKKRRKGMPSVRKNSFDKSFSTVIRRDYRDRICCQCSMECIQKEKEASKWVFMKCHFQLKKLTCSLIFSKCNSMSLPRHQILCFCSRNAV